MKFVPKLLVLGGLAAASWIIVISDTAVAAHVAVKLGRHAHAMRRSSQLSTLTAIPIRQGIELPGNPALPLPMSLG